MVMLGVRFHWLYGLYKYTLPLEKILVYSLLLLLLLTRGTTSKLDVGA